MKHITDQWPERFERMRSLVKGWDSYNADPPSEVALKHAAALTGMFVCENISPSADGGVNVGGFHLGHQFLFECANDGEIGLCYTVQGERHLQDFDHYNMLEIPHWMLARHNDSNPPSPAPMPERSATIGGRRLAGGMGEAERGPISQR